MAINKAWFTDRLTAKNMNQKELAAKLGVIPERISLTLSGKRRLQLNEAVELAKILDVALDDVLANAGIKLPVAMDTPSKQVPVNGHIDGQFKVHPANAKPLGKAPGLPGVKSFRVVRFQADSVMDRVLLYYKTVEAPKSELAGLRAIVEIEGEPGLHLRYIKKGYTSGHFNLSHPFDGENILEADVKLGKAYPVICLRE